MAPIRRYLRISPDWVLEVRVYLDNPALTHTWLLNPRESVLPRVIQAVKPLIKPKLWEERERAQGRGKKKKGVKDVVVEDDFEASIFLTDLSTPHSLLTKQKEFSNAPQKIRSNSGKLTSWLGGAAEKPIDVEDDAPVVIREESDDEGPSLMDYPEAGQDHISRNRNSRKRRRKNSAEEAVYVSDVSEDEGFQDEHRQGSTNRILGEDAGEIRDVEDDKKKLRLNTSYDGFKIFGRILCLVVKRRGNKSKSSGVAPDTAGQKMLETWVSTQAAQEPQGIDDD